MSRPYPVAAEKYRGRALRRLGGASPPPGRTEDGRRRGGRTRGGGGGGVGGARPPPGVGRKRRGGGGSGLVGDGIPTPAYPLLRISIYYAAFAIPSESDVLRRHHRRKELEPVRRDQVVRAGRAE